MRRHLALPLALLFIAFGVPSNAQNAGDEALITVEEGAPLTVECALRVEERAEWRLDGRAVPADLRPAGEAAAAGRLLARLHAPAARPHHAGAYTCARAPAARVLVRVRAAPAPLAPPAEAAAVAAGAAPDEASNLQWYDVPLSFSINCTLVAVDGEPFVWKKNNTLVEELPDLRNRYKVDQGGSVLRVERPSNEDDFGNYTCSVGAANQTYELRGRPHAKMQHNTNVVEHQPLKMSCKVTGKPYPTMVWLFRNESMNYTDAVEALSPRASLKPNAQGVEGAELVLSEAWRSDAGEYTCLPAGVAGSRNASTTLRVKDQYAALWPFLGICAEVFVLCAIILVYEKRRTKPELDDSDTDNHDQKKS